MPVRDGLYFNAVTLLCDPSSSSRRMVFYCSHFNLLDGVCWNFFINKIHGCTFLPYHQRLHKLSLHSLHHRLIVIDIVTIYSIISGCMSIPRPTFICLIPQYIIRGHNLKITIPILRYSTSKQNFISQTAVLWNGLPVSLLCTLSPITFRRQIAAYV